MQCPVRVNWGALPYKYRNHVTKSVTTEMNLISKPSQVYQVWNYGWTQLLLKTGAHKGKKCAMAFHVNTKLLRSSALWLLVCLSCGFTQTYMHADVTHFRTFSKWVRLWERVRTSALPGFVWKDMWTRTGRIPEEGRSTHISWVAWHEFFSRYSVFSSAPPMERAGVFSSRRTCFTSNSASSASLSHALPCWLYLKGMRFVRVRFYLASGWVHETSELTSSFQIWKPLVPGFCIYITPIRTRALHAPFPYAPLLKTEIHNLWSLISWHDSCT